MSGDLSSLVARLEAVTVKLESVACRGGGAGAPGAEDNGEIVEAYDKFMAGNLAKMITLSNEIGGDLAEQVKLWHNGFKAQRDFMVLVSKHKSPNAEGLQKLLMPTSQCVSAVQEFREKHRSSKLFNNLSALSEGVPCLGWVTVVKGAIYLKDTLDSAQFYLNRVIKDNKEKEPKQVEWARAVKGVYEDLTQYIKDHHASGLSWNPSGPPAPTSAPPPPPAGGAPPPPPPPAVVPPSGPAPSQEKSVASAVFSQINKAGTNISSGLRKVTDDMKTHKNPSLRSTSVVPSKPKLAPKPTASKPAPAAKKPPVFELQGGKKWIVDYQENNRGLVINGEMQQTIYVYMCKNSTLQVKGKVNSITLDNCKKCAVVFDSVVSTCEFINCQSVQCQVTGNVPTISIDKTDGCQVYLSKESMYADIVSAKSSEMNVLVPKDDGDMAEFALPEQFKTKWDGKAFVTVCSDI